MSFARRGAIAAAFLSLAFTSAAVAQSTTPSFPCGGSPPQPVKLAPVTKFGPIDFTNQGADCAMWQNFFYLNWPVTPGKRGVPNQNAKFGGPGPTVWETYKTVEQVFLPDGVPPLPWNKSLLLAGLARGPAADIAAGRARALTRSSKISHMQMVQIARNFASNDTFLKDIKQADGNVLFDQQKIPAYYEIAMNQRQFDYITTYDLYNATKQLAYAQKTNIALPIGSIELKAAWKVLTPAEIKANRFHMTTGYILSPLPIRVTVGLVGLHVFTGGGTDNVGLWGTFAQVDNVPLSGKTGSGPYSFNNPSCTNCKVNDPTTDPTQATQVFPDDPLADKVNAMAQAMIKGYDPNTPWQYYKLIDVQWSPQTVDIKTPVPIPLPLPMGKPSVDTLVNPVLETFMQTQGTSCLGCHAAFAGTASNGKIGAGYSFMFGYAQAPKQAAK